MFNVPASVWQAIARANSGMTSRWGRAMAGGQEEIDRLIQEVDAEHEAAGVPNGVSLAFEITAPLVVENDAIQRWLRETDRFDLTGVLLDLPTPREAGEVGTLEYRLEPAERTLLESLLAQEVERAERDALAAAAPRCVLLSDGMHLREGLKRFRAMRAPRKSDRASFAFDGSFLSIDALGSMFAARATGAWPGVATCTASVVLALVKAPPVGAEVELGYADGHLRVGALAVTAEWKPVSGELLALPAAPDWVETLSLNYRVHRARLLQSGRLREVEAAEKKLAATIAKAAKALAPLGVPEPDLRRLVERVLEERWRAGAGRGAPPR